MVVKENFQRIESYEYFTEATNRKSMCVCTVHLLSFTQELVQSNAASPNYTCRLNGPHTV